MHGESWSRSQVKKFLPYILITLFFVLSLFLWHRQIFSYRFNQNIVHDYLRSQDIEDPNGLIKDRITVSDSDIYIATGYLYAKGEDPTLHNFQHPPLVKYLFGFSTLLTNNPYYVQMIFGLILLFLTYFLGIKLFKNNLAASIGIFLLLIDPVFQGMQGSALLDLGQAVFALSYLILVFFYPENYILGGFTLGLFAASKFWSTAIILVVLVALYKHFIQKKKLYYKETFMSFAIGFIVFGLTYVKSFIDSGYTFNIVSFLAKDLRFMLTHNSASSLGGPLILFVTGYFAPWWQKGVEHATDWSFLWPVGLIASIGLAVKTKMTDIKFFFYSLPAVYLLLESTQVPFTRYFIIILPFIYLSLGNLIARVKYRL